MFIKNLSAYDLLTARKFAFQSASNPDKSVQQTIADAELIWDWIISAPIEHIQDSSRLLVLDSERLTPSVQQIAE